MRALNPTETIVFTPPARDGAVEKINVHVPQTYRDGAAVVVPLTFANGLDAELVHPDTVDVAALGVRPYWAAHLGDVASRDFLFPPGGSAWFVGNVPLATYPVGGSGRSVELWQGPEGGAERYLLYRFGRWHMAVWDGAGGARMSEDQLSAMAVGIRGRELPSGYLALDASPPVQLSDPGEASGPALEFGSDGKSVRVVVEDCGGADIDTRSADGTSGQRCFSEIGISVSAYGDPAFVDAVLNSTVRLAPSERGATEVPGGADQ